MRELPENAVLVLIAKSGNSYVTLNHIFLKVDRLISKETLFLELDRFVKNRFIRIKGMNKDLYIAITAIGIAFLAECANLL